VTGSTYLLIWLRARVFGSERGANLVEYILIISVLAVGVIGSIGFFRSCVVAKTAETGCQIDKGDQPVNPAQCAAEYNASH